MLLLYTYNHLLILLGYVIFYYGLLTTYNVATIFMLTKACSKDQINSLSKSNGCMMFGLSVRSLRCLTAVTIGIINDDCRISKSITNNN